MSIVAHDHRELARAVFQRIKELHVVHEQAFLFGNDDHHACDGLILELELHLFFDL